MKKVCITCNKKYDGREDRGNYCSWKCYIKNVRVPEIACKKCGIIFQPLKTNRFYCSRKCYIANTKGIHNHFYGKHHTSENKKIMAEYKIGKKLSIEHRDKLSEAHKWVTGENNPFYGRSIINEVIEVKTLVEN